MTEIVHKGKIIKIEKDRATVAVNRGEMCNHCLAKASCRLLSENIQLITATINSDDSFGNTGAKVRIRPLSGKGVEAAFFVSSSCLPGGVPPFLAGACGGPFSGPPSGAGPPGMAGRPVPAGGHACASRMAHLRPDGGAPVLPVEGAKKPFRGILHGLRTILVHDIGEKSVSLPSQNHKDINF